MNDTVHGHMVQDLLRHRFGSHDNLICKYSQKYPVQAEREFQRLTNAYIRILNELLKEYLPEIRDAARAEREAGQRHDDASDLIAKVKTVFSKMTVELERRTSMFGLRSKIESMAKLTRKLSIREWKKAVKSTLGIDLMDDYYTGELYRTMMERWVEDNVALIKTIPQESLGRMRQIVLEGYRNGETTTVIVKQIQRTYSVDRRHAQLLARYQIDYLNNKIAWNGDAETGLRGVLSKDNDVPLYVPATGAKGSTKWADKTEDEILADITGMLKQVARTTKKVEKPDTLALPSEAYIEIQNRRIESTATTVLKYVQDNIKDIARIVSCPELDPDSVDTNPYAAESDGKGVALLFKNDPRKFTIENPLSFMQYPVQPEGLEMVVPCEARTAGAIIYYPMSMLIATGIC